MKYLGVCKFKNGSRYRVGFDSSTDKAKKRMSHLIKAHFSVSDIYDRGGVEKIVIYDITSLANKEFSEINKRIQDK